VWFIIELKGLQSHILHNLGVQKGRGHGFPRVLECAAQDCAQSSTKTGSVDDRWCDTASCRAWKWKDDGYHHTTRKHDLQPPDPS